MSENTNTNTPFVPVIGAAVGRAVAAFEKAEAGMSLKGWNLGDALHECYVKNGVGPENTSKAAAANRKVLRDRLVADYPVLAVRVSKLDQMVRTSAAWPVDVWDRKVCQSKHTLFLELSGDESARSILENAWDVRTTLAEAREALKPAAARKATARKATGEDGDDSPSEPVRSAGTVAIDPAERLSSIMRTVAQLLGDAVDILANDRSLVVDTAEGSAYAIATDRLFAIGDTMAAKVKAAA